jgi:hypothetical protein
VHIWTPQSRGSKGEQVFLARSLAKSEAYLIRLRPAAWVIGPSVPLEFVHRDEHPGSDSTDVELPFCDQIIEGALADRKHSSCLSTADKDPIVRIRKSSGGRFLLEVASLVHDYLRLRAHICCVQIRELGSRLSNEISSGKYSMPE